jgi:SPP1 gp7 family putative phage head morphogenesis protein
MSEAANLYADALAWAKAQKITLPDEYYGAISAASRNRSFSVAGLAQLDALQAVHKSLIDALASGKTQREWAKALLADPTAAQMLAMPAHRLDNIFRTNLQTGYMRGIARQQESPASLKRRPFFQYDAINDSRTRPSHSAMDNFIAPADDGVWKIWTPPNGYRCRCIRVALSAAEARARGYDGSTQPVPSNPDAGWGHHPLDGDADFLESIKAERLKQAHPAIVDAFKNQLPWREKMGGTPEAQWHDVSFNNAPDWIKAAVARRGGLKGTVTTRKDGAYYSPVDDSLNMPLDLDSSTLLNQATWRHEYGHALDVWLAGEYAYRSAEPDFQLARKQDGAELVRKSAAGPSNFKDVINTRTRLDDTYKLVDDELLKTENASDWLEKRFADSGFDFSLFKSEMQRYTDFAVTLENSELNRRYGRIIVSIENGDGQGLIDALTGGISIQSTFERHSTYEKGLIGALSDLFGSATLNKVAGLNKSGFGHDDDYYKQLFTVEAECFANLTNIYGVSSPVLIKIVEIMTPSMAKLFKEILK